MSRVSARRSRGAPGRQRRRLPRSCRLVGLFCLLAVSLVGCRSGGSADKAGAQATGASAAVAAQSTTVPPPTTTTAPAPGPRSATGAVGGVADERIGPPGVGKPVRFSITEGQCFNELLDSAVDPPAHSFQIVDCGQMHDAEVFAVLPMSEPPGAPYPGDQATEREVNRLCLARFTPYIGTEYARSALRMSVMRPVGTTWATGDRTVVCAVYDGRLEPLAGSMRGTGR